VTTTAVADVVYRPVPKLWTDATCVLFGGGPSLTPQDVASCEGKAHAIAIKEAYRLAPWADAMYSCEAGWWRYEWRFHPEVQTFAGLKYSMEPVSYPGVLPLKNTGNTGLELDPTGLRTGYNSGYQALNLAVHLGATRIVLLGFDMWTSPTGQSNWYTHQTARYHRDSPYPIFLQAFTSLVEPLRDAGIEVINCSRQTILSTFPRQPLEEVLP